MSTAQWPLFLAFLICIAFGFWQGYRFAKKRQKASLPTFDDRYFKGLNYLLNEQPDAAVDTFIQALDVNSETLETHLSLAKLLRKRGEVDRAIRIHQNLLARPGLTKEQSQQAQYELATDFAKAGLLDRAEGLLKTLVETEGPFQINGLKRLLEVYLDEKEWELGLQVLSKLAGSRFSKHHDEWAQPRAHFCCELAEVAIFKQDYDKARHWLKLAIGFEKNNARAILLLGRLEIAVNKPAKGVAQLQKIADLNPEYISEALPYLREGFRALGDLAKYRQWLEDVYKHTPTPVIACELAEIIASVENQKAALEFIAGDVRLNPSGMGLHALLDFYLEFADGKSKEHLSSLQTVMAKIISNAPSYQCGHCGFRSQTLYWLCPSCKNWGSIKPVKDMVEYQ